MTSVPKVAACALGSRSVQRIAAIRPALTFLCLVHPIIHEKIERGSGRGASPVMRSVPLLNERSDRDGPDGRRCIRPGGKCGPREVDVAGTARAICINGR